MTWLTPRRGTKATTAVLRLLLENRDWPHDIRDVTVDKALSWAHPKNIDGAPVLATMLQNDSLTEHQRRIVRETALEWIRQHPGGPGRGFLVHAFLTTDKAQEALDALWSSARSQSGSAFDPIAVYQLLEHQSISPERVRLLVDIALEWLEHTQDHEDRRLVITAVLRREDRTAAQTARLASVAMPMLDEPIDPRFLTVLLYRGSFINDVEARRVVTYALAICRSHPGIKKARPLINAMLRRRDLTPEQAREVVAIAVEHLEIDDGRKAGILINSLIERTDLLPAELIRAFTHAVRWLEKHRDFTSDSRYFYILRDLLHRPDLSPEVAAACERHAQHWLSSIATTDPRAEPINARIPYRTGLPPPNQHQA